MPSNRCVRCNRDVAFVKRTCKQGVNVTGEVVDHVPYAIEGAKAVAKSAGSNIKYAGRAAGGLAVLLSAAEVANAISQKDGKRAVVAGSQVCIRRPGTKRVRAPFARDS